MSASIERDSPEPYYQQLYAILCDRIAAGEIAAGERFPSEGELCREFSLSRATVRQALQKLEADGWAQRVPRRGVYAASPDTQRGWVIQDAEGFLESQLRHDREGIATTVLSGAMAVAPADVAAELDLDDGGAVFELTRVRTLDGSPALFSTNWFPEPAASLIAGASAVLDGTGSVNGTLRDGGLVTQGARRILHATTAPPAVADALGLPGGAPVLRVSSLSWDVRGTRFDFYRTWVRTDVIPLEVRVEAATS